MVELSKLEAVDLREVWKHEASNFTPWLADNIEELSDVLGLDLEVKTSEAEVGTFSLDILAHDLASDRPVVIENQLEGTDHDHLGKLLTYAAGYDAHILVWIVKEFRPEHRAAIDWLNRRTGEDTAFFGIAVEAWRIKDSPPAARFNVVALPNDWEKQGAHESTSSGSETLSVKRSRYRDFWQPLVDQLRDTHDFTRAKKGQPQNWMHFGSGFSGLPFGVSFQRGNVASVSIRLDRGDKDDNERTYDALHERKSEIEAELGQPLTWNRMDHAKASEIGVRREGTIDDDDESLAEIREWMIRTVLSFDQVFRPHLIEILD
ncbi:MAG: DUF4268 domain-containing protein [Chloroflexi bacterium]|nr:DUF4268 domain-containing protein [Chloroflexota bacterium]